MVRDAQLHGRRDAQRFMDATEIIVRHIKRDRRLVTFELLTERIGEAGEAAFCVVSHECWAEALYERAADSECA